MSINLPIFSALRRKIRASETAPRIGIYHRGCSAGRNDEIALIGAERKKIPRAKELHDIRTGTFAVGTNNQYFTNLDFVNGMLRDQSMYTWYPLLLTFQDERFTLEQCCALVHRFDYAYSNYLRYSGLQEMGAFAEAITQISSDGCSGPCRCQR
ncbi:hypothetical protein [Agrobacterium salinitolerans]|uniref:cucumopine synthase-related protein n=1 Tax=Agrobacterium salinitolerans TaxID=1183413 RepID=UPI003A1030A9